METSYLKTLELDKIIARAAEGCVCKEAKAKLLALEPQCDPDEVRYALEQMRPGDMLLLCGKGREGYQLVQGKKIPYDEEETVRSCARELLESRPQAL